jgi:hypothetical protein
MTKRPICRLDGLCGGIAIKVPLKKPAFYLILLTAESITRLASSNFFMQVLNAPTRQEVDNAHFKTRCWISLFLSSIPIHLLFNSAVFEVDRRESDFHLTIATEQFLYGGDFYPPGSSLALPGLVSADDSSFLEYNPIQYYAEVCDYGYLVNRSDYKNHLSPVISNVSYIAKNAAGWERLEIAEVRCICPTHRSVNL